MTLPKEFFNSRPGRVGVAALLLGLLLVLVVLMAANRREVMVETPAATPSGLPQPVLESLSKTAVWCFADFMDRFGRKGALNYYPTLSHDDAVYAPGSERWMAQNAHRQYVRCYTTWEAAFHHQDVPYSFIRYTYNLKRVAEWMPENANEADYEIGLLYGLYQDRWQEARNPAFTPSIRPHRWVLTEQ
ncbi:MAG: hypothetical protein R3A44_30785 [Caldilineaceae bacterium]